MSRRRFNRTKISSHHPARRYKKRRFFGFFLKSTLAAALLVLFFILGLFIYFAKDLPSPENISARLITQSTKIFDRTGETLLYDIHGEEKRTVIPLSEIPRPMQFATIAIEDHLFYEHHGIYFRGIVRAFIANFTGRHIAQGGSTITQQYIKNSFLTPERTYPRKIKEAILALELEIKYSKDEILTFYLNEIPYGSNAYGVEAAAQTFFGKSARDLTLAESALLAALPQATSYYSPYGNHPEELSNRQHTILRRMRDLDFITENEMNAAIEEKLVFSRSPQRIIAPHFVMMIREELNNTYGEDYIERSGLKVYTTLDMHLQHTAEEAVNVNFESLSEKYNTGNVALAATDPKSGEILALVGSHDYFDIENDGNVNVAIRPRQPGSSFKPFAYSVAFQKGYSPDTVVFDLPTEFALAGSPSYKPHNYDYKYRGPISLRYALAQSLNIPAVKVLYLAGIDDTIDFAHSLGITTLNERNRYGLALVLGGGEVKLLDMVGAYGAFAANGVYHPVTGILRIEDAEGKTIYESSSEGSRVMEPNIARLMSDVLSDNEARSAVFGARSTLYIPERQVAVKTGTTQNFRDGWTIGYTPSLSAGVWSGNNNNTPMRDASGSRVAGLVWNTFMTKALADMPDEKFETPEITLPDKPMLNGKLVAEEYIQIDKASGKRATQYTPPEFIEKRTYASVHTILHYISRKNPLGTAPDNPVENDPQYANWEFAVREWANDPKRKEEGLFFESPPGEYDTIHLPENAPRIEIIVPRESDRIQGRTLRVSVNSEGIVGKIKQIDFFIDDILVGSRAIKPYDIYLTIPASLDFETAHVLRVRAYDEYGNAGMEERTFYILDR